MKSTVRASLVFLLGISPWGLLVATPHALNFPSIAFANGDSGRLRTSLAQVEPDEAAQETQSDAADDAAEIRETLHALWDGSRDEIATAKIRYLSLTFSCSEQNLTFQEFDERLEKLSFIDNPDIVKDVLSAFRPDLDDLPDDEYQLWVDAIASEQTYLSRGQEERCVSQDIGHLRNNDLHLLVNTSNTAVTAYLPGGCPILMHGLNWFRVVPLNEMLSEASTIRRTEAGIEIEDVDPRGGAASLLLVDENTGLPLRWELFAMPGKKLSRVQIFRDDFASAGDVQLPGTRVQVNVANGMVGLVQMTIIRDSQINFDIPDEEFQLAVDERWSWFDKRTEVMDGRKFEKPVTDVAAYFRERTSVDLDAAAPHASASLFTNWRTWAFLLNGLILVVVGVYLWRRSL